MSYYDHATHLALRLDQWDLRGQNGTGSFHARPEVKLKPITKKRVKRRSLAVFIKRWFQPSYRRA